VFNKRKPEPPKPELPLPELRVPLPELDPMPAELPATPPPLPEPEPEPEPVMEADAEPAAVLADDGLDMPAFHEEEAPDPLPPETETPMARSPFAPALPPLPSSGMRAPVPAQEPARRTLVVGRGISVQGVVQDAERLVVEGTVEATMINGLTELSIAPGGVFKGEVEVDEAEVAGTIDGTLTARNALIVRASGRVLGTARCRRLQVEDGGQITGRIEMLSEPVSYEA
jgi:cytoskeletal protein CcmA (bactofilin family)